MRRVSGHYTNKFARAIKFDVEIPGSWKKMDYLQRATALEILSYRRSDKNVTAASLLAVLFQKHWHIVANLPDEELHALLPLTNFMLETMPPAVNDFPKIRIQRKVCFAPADDLNNICFGEWCFAYQAYSAYRTYHDPVFLDKLIAILYRPADPAQNANNPDFRGDIRQLFNENLIDTRAKSVKEILPKVKHAVLAWFTAALIQVMNPREHVFPIKEDDQQPAPASQPERTWFDVFRELIGPKWGTTEQLKHTNAIWVIDDLEAQQIELKASGN